MPKYQQQGDCLLFPIESLPAAATPRSDKVLAEGEATGHAHRIVGRQATVYQDPDGSRYLEALQNCVLKHEEHHKQMIPSGIYRIARVQEYDHFAEEAREVRD